MADPTLVHASCIRVGDSGVLIRGASGAGKTQTALTLLRRGRTGEVDVRFVSDDQTLLDVTGDPPRLVAHCPGQIKGQFEVYGFGIFSDPNLFVPKAEIALVVDLVETGMVARMQPQSPIRIEGVDLPQLLLPAGNPALCASAISAALDIAEML